MLGQLASLSVEVAVNALSGEAEHQEVAESGRLRPSGAACAKKGGPGRMQRPPELVPIPESLRKASESYVKLLHFGKILKKFG